MRNVVLAVVVAGILAACSGGPPKQADSPESDMKPRPDAPDVTSKADKHEAPKPEAPKPEAPVVTAPPATSAAPMAAPSGSASGKAPAAKAPPAGKKSK